MKNIQQILLQSYIHSLTKNIFSEAVAQKCSVKKVFLEISQNSQEDNSGTGFLHWILSNF